MEHMQVEGGWSSRGEEPPPVWELQLEAPELLQHGVKGPVADQLYVLPPDHLQAPRRGSRVSGVSIIHNH